MASVQYLRPTRHSLPCPTCYVVFVALGHCLNHTLARNPLPAFHSDTAYGRAMLLLDLSLDHAPLLAMLESDVVASLSSVAL